MTKQAREADSLKKLIKAACQPDEGKTQSYEMGTEAWEEWTETRSHAKDRKRAVKELKRLGTTAVEATVDSLIKILDSGGRDVRTAAAAEALGMLGNIRSVPMLIEHIQYSGERTGEACAEALVRIGKPSVNPLLKFLTNANLSTFGYGDDSGIRLALRALGQIGDYRALEPLSLIFKFASAAGRHGDVTQSELTGCVGVSLKGIDSRPRTLLERLMGRRPWVR